MQKSILNRIKEAKMNNRYEFRIIKDNEAEQAVRIEQVCFPPNEAYSGQGDR